MRAAYAAPLPREVVSLLLDASVCRRARTCSRSWVGRGRARVLKTLAEQLRLAMERGRQYRVTSVGDV